MSRAEDGSINVFENRCAHRAAEFCRELSGNAKEFVCPYHQWSYDLKGNLAGVPFRRGVDGKGGMPRDFKNCRPRAAEAECHHASRRRVRVATATTWSRSPTISGRKSSSEFEATFDGRKLKLLGHYRHTPAGQLEALSREPQGSRITRRCCTRSW